MNKKRVLLIPALLCALLCALRVNAATLEDVKVSGYVGGELRFFPDDSLGSANYGENVSFATEPEFYYSAEDSNDNFRLRTFFRWDQHDAERTHFDIRELKWQKVEKHWELSVGVNHLFWGVTESIHLVNIINQQDLVENLDGESLLGQPMVQLDIINDWGTVGLFVMPYFRERIYAGIDGRPGGNPLIDQDNPIYESAAENTRTDIALRWSHFVGSWDLGLSYFHGTSREPRFDPTQVSIDPSGRIALRPIYEVIDQVGGDVQGTFDGWLLKLEAIYRKGQLDPFFAAAVGVEYTFFGIQGSGIDLGIFSEYLYDEREDQITTDNDLSLGIRLAINDINSTDLVAAVVQDLDNQSKFFFVEGSRRIGEAYKLSIEARGTNSVDAQDPLQLLENDGYVELELAYFF